MDDEMEQAVLIFQINLTKLFKIKPYVHLTKTASGFCFSLFTMNKQVQGKIITCNMTVYDFKFQPMCLNFK